jgi:hypothetical protein
MRLVGEEGPQQKNATAAFLGEGAQTAGARLELSDVQGLWGGRRTRVDGGRAVVRVVSPGLSVHRCEFGLEPGEWQRLLDLLVEQDFLTIRPPERLGIPDESRPAITLVNTKGEEWTVAKWAGVKDVRFEAIQAALLKLEAMTAGLEPVYTGPYLASGE